MNIRTMGRLALVLLLAVISAPVTRPQEKDKAKKADKPASRQEWSSKQDEEAEWTAREPQTGEEWFGRGYQFHNSDRYPEAIEAFKHAADLGHRKGTAMYNIACGYSLLNDKENAFIWLAQALSNDFSSTDLLFKDSDLDPLRSDPRFKLILSSVPAATEDREGKRHATIDRLEQANLDFAKLERESSKEGTEWARVGMQMLMLRDLDRSTVALNRAVSLLDYKGSSAMYNLACAYSLKGDRAAGIQWLEKSVNAGFDSPEKLRNDPDINNLRSDARFPAIEKLSNTLSLSQFPHDKDGSSKSEDSNYSKQRWAPAIVLYQSFVSTNPNSGRAWFNLGLALHYSREHTKAISAFERAATLGYQKPTAIYNVACAYAMLNQRDAAFEWLDRALAAGFDSYGNLSWDKDLDNLKSDPRFKRFRDTANYNTQLNNKLRNKR